MIICLVADATSVHTLRWAEYFVQQGDKVHLITYEEPKNEITGVDVHVIRSVFSSLYLAFLPRHLKIYRLIRKIKPDIVHAHFISKFGFHAAFLNFRPVVMSAWGDDILIIPHWSTILWKYTQMSLRRADLIYAASENIQKKIIDDFGIDTDKVKINAHGVDTDHFKPELKDKNENEIVVFSNRSFYPVYDIETLIETIPLVIEKCPSVVFWIMGEGPQENFLKKYAKQLGVDRHIKWMEWTSSSEMPNYLNSCDIFVSTAISDGTPVSMLEAMACAKPCIMTDVGGVGEWIVQNKTGFLIPPKNSRLLAEKILSLANDKAERYQIGNNAREIVIKFADKKRIMICVKDDYIDLIEKAK